MEGAACTTFHCPMCEKDIAHKALIGHIPTCYHAYCAELNVEPYCTCSQCQGKRTHHTPVPTTLAERGEEKGELVVGVNNKRKSETMKQRDKAQERKRPKANNNTTVELERLVLHDGDDQVRLVDLQPEVLFHIATACAPADVEALGATCSLMRASVARDEIVWRRLFERDHVLRLYRHRNSRRTPVHVRYPPSRSRWPAEALKVCALDVGPLAHHPPSLPDDGDAGGKGGRAVPAALAHLMAAGKTWRWIYIAHARALLSPVIIGSSPLQPGPLSCVRAMTTTTKQWKGMELFVGDVVDGKRHGLGVELDLNQRDKDEEEAEMITGWTAGVWANDRVNGWCVYSADVRYQTGVAVDGSWSGLSFSALSHVRSWGRVGTEGDIVAPWFGLYDRGSFRRTFIPTMETLWTPFYEGDFTRDLKLGRHGQATIRFHNGDIIMQQWRDDDLVGIDKLVCSPTCPDGEFAGRTLGAGAQWRVSWFDMNVDGWRDNAYWPEGGVDEAEERAFWRYVALGLIGWSEPVCEHALKNAPYALAHAAELAALRVAEHTEPSMQ